MMFLYLVRMKFYPYDFFEMNKLRVFVCCASYDSFINTFVVFFMFSLRLQNYAMTVPDGFAFMHVNISHYRYHVCFYMRDVQKYIISH